MPWGMLYHMLVGKRS